MELPELGPTARALACPVSRGRHVDGANRRPPASPRAATVPGPSALRHDGQTDAGGAELAVVEIRAFASAGSSQSFSPRRARAAGESGGRERRAFWVTSGPCS